MTMASWFTQPEHGGFPVERAAPAAVISLSPMSAANGNGWSGALAGMWRKGRRGPVLLPASQAERFALPDWM
jgi:hypothetical protein